MLELLPWAYCYLAIDLPLLPTPYLRWSPPFPPPPLPPPPPPQLSPPFLIIYIYMQFSSRKSIYDTLRLEHCSSHHNVNKNHYGSPEICYLPKSASYPIWSSKMVAKMSLHIPEAISPCTNSNGVIFMDKL